MTQKRDCGWIIELPKELPKHPLFRYNNENKDNIENENNESNNDKTCLVQINNEKKKCGCSFLLINQLQYLCDKYLCTHKSPFEIFGYANDKTQVIAQIAQLANKLRLCFVLFCFVLFCFVFVLSLFVF